MSQRYKANELLLQQLESRFQRHALSCRAIAREYGVARELPADLARQGILPALRRGRALLILRTDWEGWWRQQTAARDALIKRRGAEVLMRGDTR